MQLSLIATNAATWERKLLNGRPHWVGPATMIVPGVLNGSKGPLMYTPEDIKKALNAWNGMPLTLGHPRDDAGNFTSARSSGVLDRYQLGTVLNARYDGKLKADVWVDEQLCANKAPQVLSAIQQNRPVELSTGLGTDDQPAPSNSVYVNPVTNVSKPFVAYARNHEPDHLAVLVGQKGACSLNDGCGLGVNHDGGCDTTNKGTTEFTTCPECGGKMENGKCQNCGYEMPVKNLDVSGTGAAGSPLRMDIGGTEPKTANGVLARMWETVVNALTGKPLTTKCVSCGQYHNSGGKDMCDSCHERYVSNSDSYALVSVVPNVEEDVRTRKEKIAFLVANCDCWKGKDQLLQNEQLVDNATLDKFVANAQQTADERNTLNTLRTEFKLDDSLAVNAMPAALKAALDKKKGKEPDEDDSDTNNKDKTRNDGTDRAKETTVNLSNLSAENIDALSKAIFGQPASVVKAGLAFTTNAEKVAREQLVARLVANASTPEQRKIAAEIYSKLSLPELESLTSTIPAVRNAEYDGPTDPLAAILARLHGVKSSPTTAAHNEEELETLPEPTTNWAGGCGANGKSFKAAA